MRFCEACGTQLDDGVQFCKSCGTPVVQSPPEQQYVPPQGQYAPPSQQQYQQAPPPQQQYAPPPQQQYAQPAPQQQYQQAPPPQQQQQQYAPPQQQQQYVPQQQQGYQQGGAAYSAKPPKKPLPKALILICIIAAAAVIVGLFVVPNLLGGAADKDYFEIGADRVPSVKYVLGDAPGISSFSNSKSGGVEQVVVQYKAADDPAGDMKEYTSVLISKYGFYSVNGFDFSDSRGRDIQFAKESDEDGYVVMVTIDYSTSGYTLTIARGEGTLNIQGVDEPPVTEEPPNTDEPPVVEDDPTTDTDPANTGPGPGEVDVICPALLSIGSSVEEAQGKVPNGVTVVSLNSDGSFTYRMTTQTQQALIDAYYEYTFDKMDEALGAGVPGLLDIAYEPSEFQGIYFIIDPGSFDQNSEAFSNSIITVAIFAAITQMYMGKGNNTSVWCGWGPEEGDEYGAFFSPDFLANY